MLGSQTEKGVLLVLPHDYKTIDQLRAAANQGLVDENGTNLRVAGKLKPFGKNGLAADLSGMVEWKQAKARAVSLISPFGGGVTIIAAAEQASYNQKFAAYAESLARSVKFSKPQIPPVVDQWKQKFSNCRLTYMSSYNSGYGGGGYSDKTIIDLCAKGHFNYSDKSETIINAGELAGGYQHSNQSGAGTWTIISRGAQPVLKLTFHNGTTYEFVLSDREGKTYLDDNRYFRTYSNSSVEDGRPQCW